MFGIMANLDRPDEHPTYGFLAPPGVKGANVNGYGDAVVTFKKDVRNRSTFTVGDSFREGHDQLVIPTPVNSPGITALDSKVFDVHDSANFQPIERLQPKRYSPEQVQAAHWTDLNERVSYVEAQMHGKITARDIAHIEFDFAHTNNVSSKELLARLDSMGITYSKREETWP